MIPKTVHYCWFGNAPRSDLNKRCMESWYRLLPGYRIKEWNETNSPIDGAYAGAAYARGQWSKVSNYIRLYALYEEGGVYLDTDVEVIKDFSPLLHDECFVAFQQLEEDMDWINNAVLGARPGHPFLRCCLGLTVEAFARGGTFLRSPTVTTEVLKEWGLRDYGLQKVKGVTIYPREYFYPYPWYGKFSPDCIEENTYCVHHWEGTWFKKQQHAKMFRKQQHANIPRPLRIIKKIARTLLSKSL